jgi:hypothetical protein
MKAARRQSTLFFAQANGQSESISGNWFFRENTVDSEIRAVLAEYREEFPISVGLCHEDWARFRAGARNAEDSNEASGIPVFYSV